jgi:hypothetical protein
MVVRLRVSHRIRVILALGVDRGNMTSISQKKNVSDNVDIDNIFGSR